ncbi:MAG: cyclopropane-fatty-acyl-phospholipid synthase family protein [Planctomycetes bacterium]|nr:cyclopropane-fatty-acyl-phospholipid synthase family protein [Planctomycetota bacterium]
MEREPLGLRLAEKGRLPEFLIRYGIRRLCRRRLGDEERRDRSLADFATLMRKGPVAPVPEKANEQHYELPPEFFRAVLGPRLKYSSCLYPTGRETLAEAEEAALHATAEHALLADGQRVLELGCGWGSLTLHMAGRFPGSRITAVSNSAPQREFILARAAERGQSNVEVLTADMNEFAAPDRYDRVVSVEMFEHMRNWEELLRRISGWLAPEGRLFLHVFAHRAHAYEFETGGRADWMGRHFFTGGIMPADRLLDEFAGDLAIEDRWVWDGTHYARTAKAWLANQDARRAELWPVLERIYGPAAKLWWNRWRIFFLSCAELFGFRRGSEWHVCHYRLRKD